MPMIRGYSTRLTGPVGPVAVLVVVLLLVALLPVPARANYELYRQHRQRQQMERQTQMRHHEEKKSEFVKGKSKFRSLARRALGTLAAQSVY